MIASLLIATLVGLAAALAVAVVGALLAPRTDAGGFEPHPPTPPWAATRCAGESLHNLKPPEPFGGSERTVAGRMYAESPSVASTSLQHLSMPCRAFFRHVRRLVRRSPAGKGGSLGEAGRAL